PTLALLFPRVLKGSVSLVRMRARTSGLARRPTSEPMSLYLLETYARLLTTDTRACARLFTPDAEYITRLGGLDLHLYGRHEIEGFIAHVPRQLCFRAADSRPENGGYRGEVLVAEGASPLGTQRVRYDMKSGRFRRFEVLQS